VAVGTHLATSLAGLATGVMLGMLAVDVAHMLCRVMRRSAVAAVLLRTLFLKAETFALLRAVQSLAATLAGRPLRRGVMLRSKTLVMLTVDARVGTAVGMHDAAAGFAGVALVLYMAAVLALFGFLVNFPSFSASLGLVFEVHFGLIDAARCAVMSAMMFVVFHGSTLLSLRDAEEAGGRRDVIHQRHLTHKQTVGSGRSRCL